MVHAFDELSARLKAAAVVRDGVALCSWRRRLTACSLSVAQLELVASNGTAPFGRIISIEDAAVRMRGQ